MAVGSAFDAYVKAALNYVLYGTAVSPKFEFGEIFESQVEPQNRDFALKAGKHVFRAYKLTGLSTNCFLCSDNPSSRRDSSSRSMGHCRCSLHRKAGLPLRARLWAGSDPLHPGLESSGLLLEVCCQPVEGLYALPGRLPEREAEQESHNTEHTNFLEYNHRGLTVNAGYMEHCNDEYADQLCLYGWLLGEKPSDENVVGMIEEIVSKPANPTPLLRVANHRARVKADYQQKLLERVGRCWQAITTGNVFPDLTPEENTGRREVLEDMAVSLGKTAGAYDDWFNEVSRPQFKR